MKRVNAILTTLLLIATVAILFSIFKNDDHSLGGNYYYLPKYEAIDIGYPGGAIIYKSMQKNVFTDVKIYGDVIGVNANNEFIIAIQRKDLTIDSSDNSELKHRYFIIVKKQDKVYGPYTKEEFQEVKKELGVPKSLFVKKE